jgi:hypothetical protein
LELAHGLNRGLLLPQGSIHLSGFFVLGLGMILFPIDVDKLRAEHGVEKVQSFGQLPPAWKVVLVAALAAGFGIWYAIAHL